MFPSVSYRCIATESPNEHLCNRILDCQTPCMYCLWRSIHLNVASTRPCMAISIMVEHHHTSEFFACVIELNALTASDTGEGSVMTGSPRDRKALRGWQTWAQPLGWPLSHRVCWVVSELVWGYHS